MLAGCRRHASASVASSSKLAGTGVSTNTNDASWSNPGRVTANDGSFASCGMSKGTEVGDALDADNFAFAIPAGATIDGIEVIIDRRESATNDNVVDHTVRLFKEGTLAGSNKADTSTEWPTTAAERTYGSPTDLWGTTWTVDNINHADHGVRLNAQAVSGSSPQADVDHITMVVYYTEAAAGDQPTSKRFGGVPFFGDRGPLTPGIQRWTRRFSGLFGPSQFGARRVSAWLS